MTDRTLYAINDQKQPFNLHENEALTFTVNWRNVIGGTVLTSTWSTEDNGITIAAQANDSYTTSCRLSGQRGHYIVVNKVVDTDGDTHERLLDVVITDNDRVTGGNDYGFRPRC